MGFKLPKLVYDKGKWPRKEDFPEWPTMKNGVSTGKIEYLSNGMKILDRSYFSPIVMKKGDTLQCTYRRAWNLRGHTLYEEDYKLAEYVCEEDKTIDLIVIVEMDDGSCEALGMEAGALGAIMGKAIETD